MPLAAPKVREDLEYFDQELDGNEVVLVRDPVRNTYFRFNPLQAAMLRALDGKRTAPEITGVLAEQYEVEIPPEAAERFIARARELMLLEITSYDVTSPAARKQVRKALRKAGLRPHVLLAQAPPRGLSAEATLFAEALRQLALDHPRAAASCLAEIRANHPGSTRARQLFDLVQTAYIRAAGRTTDFPSWVLFNPSRLLTWLSRTIGGFLFGWMGVVAMLAFVLAGAYACTLVSFEGVTLEALDAFDVTIAIAVYVIATLFHELGHGLACQHYGGNVTEIGIMFFLYIKPAAYCDTSSSYLITNRRHKVMVQMGGTVASLLFIAALAIVLALLYPSLPIYPGLALALIIEGALAFITLIPFIKSDGYYAICDHVDFPNLRDRSFRLTRGWLSERLLGIKLPTEELLPRTRRVLIAYAVVSFAFTLLFIYVAYVFTVAPIVERLRGAVLLIAFMLVVYALRNVLLRPVWNAARWIARERRQIFTRRRTAVLLVLATALIGPWFLPWPILVDAEFVVAPNRRADVRSQTAGRVHEILVKEGDRVRRGEPLARLRNAALSARIAALATELEVAATAETAETKRTRIERELARLRADEALLTLRSPIDGVVATPHLGDQLQAMLQPGDLFAEVQDLSAVIAEIALSQRDPLGEIAVGDDVVLRAYSAPHREVRAHVERIREPAQDAGGERRIIAVTSAFALDRPLSGLTGHARIYGPERSLAYANLYLPLQRFVRVQLWSRW